MMEKGFKAVDWDELVKNVNLMARGYGLGFSHTDKFLKVELKLKDGRVVSYGKHKEELYMESRFAEKSVLNLVLESVFSGRFNNKLMDIARIHATA